MVRATGHATVLSKNPSSYPKQNELITSFPSQVPKSSKTVTDCSIASSKTFSILVCLTTMTFRASHSACLHHLSHSDYVRTRFKFKQPFTACLSPWSLSRQYQQLLRGIKQPFLFILILFNSNLALRSPPSIFSQSQTFFGAFISTDVELFYTSSLEISVAKLSSNTFSKVVQAVALHE